MDKWFSESLGYPLDKVKEETRKAIIAGENPAKVAARMARALDETEKQTKNYLEAVLLTFSAQAGTDARHMVYEANKDMIKMYEWTAALEPHNSKTGRGTCPRCAALDGQKHKEIKTFPQIPLHPRCRCILTPVTPTWEELGIDMPEEEKERRLRVAKEETGLPSYVYTDKDYADWWLAHNKEWQDKAIGPRLAEWIRSHPKEEQAAAFKRLVNKNGNLIPVDKLKFPDTTPSQGPVPLATEVMKELEKRLAKDEIYQTTRWKTDKDDRRLEILQELILPKDRVDKIPIKMSPGQEKHEKIVSALFDNAARMFDRKMIEDLPVSVLIEYEEGRRASSLANSSVPSAKI
jgi:SPP1 gp7 family putative phage head morphogenesis protein